MTAADLKKTAKTVALGGGAGILASVLLYHSYVIQPALADAKEARQMIREHIEERLDRIEDKLDRVLEDR